MIRTNRQLPDSSPGYMAAGLRVSMIKAIGRENLAENPSVEVDTTGYALSGAGTISRSSEYAYRGAYSLKWIPADVAEYLTYELNEDTSSQIIGVSASLRVVKAGLRYRFGIHVVGGSVTDFNGSTEFTSTGDWQRVSFICKMPLHLTPSYIFVTQLSGQTSTIYLDALMPEYVESDNLAVSTYFDGDSLGFVPNRKDFYWKGAFHASQSVRLDQCNAGGQESFLDDIGFQLQAIVGLGMNPVSPILSQIGRGQQTYQDSIVAGRLFTLVGKIYGTDNDSLDRIRKQLEEIVLPFRASPPQPVIIRFYPEECGKNATPGRNPVEIRAVYRSGLEGNFDNAHQESLALSFEAWDSFLHNLPDAAVIMDPKDIINTRFIIRRPRNGTYEPVEGSVNALNNTVRAIVVNPGDGRVYIGGDFDNNPNYFSVWDEPGIDWDVPGASQPDDIVRALTTSPDGLYVYGGGDFISVGATVNHIFRFNTSTLAFSALGAGPGTNATVRAAATDNEGNIWFGGDFTTPGNKVVYWDGSAFVTVGSLSDNCNCLSLGPDGYMYAGFADGVRYWDGAQWVQLGSDTVGGGVNALRWWNGRLYAGGDFTSIGGISAKRAAVWNGTAWEALGDGFQSNAVRTIYEDVDGLLAFRGNFPGGPPGPSHLEGAAKWNGSDWVLEDISADWVNSAFCSVLDQDGTVWVGLGDDISADVMHVEQVTNLGTEEAEMTWILWGPSHLVRILNFQTRRSLYFDLDLLSGERAILRITRRGLFFSSQFRADLRQYILPGSRYDVFLPPGKSYVGILQTGSPTNDPYFYYRPAHRSKSGSIL